jgi:hypothetical protein
LTSEKRRLPGTRMVPGKLPRAPKIGLEAEPRACILAEHLARPDIATQNTTRTVTSRSCNSAHGRSVQRCLRCYPSADTVAGDVRCIHACPRRCGFEDRCNRVAMQSCGGYVAVTIDPAKDRPSLTLAPLSHLRSARIGQVSLCSPKTIATFSPACS